jgi:transcriptional regulator with XRE-family HTH domain
MTKKKLTVLSGVSPAFLSDVLNGKGNPSLQVMEDIAKALEVPLPSLLEQHVEYSHVFVTNVSRLMTKLGITEESLANLSGTSLSLLSEILIERRSPSLQVSEDIAKALEAPLLLLFDKNFSPDFISIPEGECITVMLPPFQASVVKKWAKAAQSKLHKP